MARPRSYHSDRPATSAERVRALRERRKSPPPAPETVEGLLATKSQKVQAHYLNVSERLHYYAQAYLAHRAFSWDDVIAKGGKGNKVGITFVADVCRHGSPEVQLAIYDLIKTKGPTEVRLVWKTLKQGGGAVALSELKAEREYNKRLRGSRAAATREKVNRSLRRVNEVRPKR